MRLRKQYREETGRIWDDTVVNADDQNTKRAYIDAIKQLLDSIYEDYSTGNRFNWWSIITNAGIIFARLMAARELSKKL